MLGFGLPEETVLTFLQSWSFLLILVLMYIKALGFERGSLHSLHVAYLTPEFSYV